MITVEHLVVSVSGVERAALERWIADEWVRPEGPPWRFSDIDVARVRLIVELREMAIDEEAVPVLLSLLDQLYETRRQMRALCGAIEGAPEDVRQQIVDALHHPAGG